MTNGDSGTSAFTIKPHLAGLGVAGLAILVRIVYFAQYLTSECNGYMHGDHVYYYSWAKHIVEGGWRAEQVFQQGPLYAYLLAGAFAIGLDASAILGLQLAVGVVTCMLVYSCGSELFGRTTGVVAGCIAAIYGPLVFYECMLMKSFLSPLFSMLVLHFGLKYADSQRIRHLALMGLSVGCACLLREVYILLMLPVLILALRQTSTAAAEDAEAVARFRGIKHACVALLACLLPILPSTVRNYLIAEEFALVTIGGGEVMYIAHGPNADGFWNSGPIKRPNAFREHEAFHEEAEKRLGRDLTRGEASRYWFRQAGQSIFDQPLRFVNLSVIKAVILLNNFDSPDSANLQVWPRFVPVLSLLPGFGVISGIGFLGVCMAVNGGPRQRYAIGLVVMHAVGVILVYNFGRFRIGMMPLWILFAAHGLVRFPDLFHLSRGWLRIGGGLLLVGLSIAVTVRAFALPPGMSPAKLGSLNDGYRNRVIKQAQTRTQLVKLEQELPSSPNPAMQHSRIAQHLLQLNRVDGALTHHRTAVELDGGNSEIRSRFGADLIATGFVDEGIAQLEAALNIDPDLADPHERLARTYQEQGELEKAIEHYSAAVRADPSKVIAANNLAMILITHPQAELRNSQRAVALAESVVRQVGRDPSVLDTLAAAYAADARFDDAIRVSEMAIQAAMRSGNERLARSIVRSRDLYRRGETRW